MLCLANSHYFALFRMTSLSHCFALSHISSHYFTFFALLYNIPHHFTLFRSISRCLLSFCTDPHYLAVFRSVSYCFAVFSIVSDCFTLLNRFLHYGRSVSYYFALFCMTSRFIVVLDGTISQYSTPLISQFRTASHKFAFVCNYVALFRIFPHQFTLFCTVPQCYRYSALFQSTSQYIALYFVSMCIVSQRLALFRKVPHCFSLRRGISHRFNLFHIIAYVFRTISHYFACSHYIFDYLLSLHAFPTLTMSMNVSAFPCIPQYVTVFRISS